MNAPIQITHAWNNQFWPTGGTEKAFLLLEMKGNAGIQSERAPMNVSLVMDRSGSMSGAPLEYSKKACQFVVEQMSQMDQLSIVAFDNEVDTVFAPQPVTHKELLKQKINSIRTGGSTNLSGGLLQGIQYVMQGKADGSVNRVLLLSDGHSNAGITDPAKLQSIAKEFHSMGVGVTTMGVGDGFDEELMEGIANQGGGNFYFIEHPEDIPGIFSKELEGLSSIVAQNVQLAIQPSGATQITNIFGYNAHDVKDGLKLSLGDVYEQEVKSILIEFTLFPHTAGTHKIVDLQWDFVDVTEGAKMISLQHMVESHFTNDLNLIAHSPNPLVEKQVKITESAIVIEHAITAFDRGDEETGIMLLQQQADEMLVAAVKSEDAELREEAQLLYSQLENFTFSSKTRKTLHEQKYRQMKRKK
ncbi:Ca-activated chloride channel family protein [Paenibacillus sp. yr247]|uniref:vWA domain-containing protein n=1 Tax=Paenibacillus sp. yr247 TaxID=1761880 RepID=UPI000883EA94|nr:VWA domain-containing protein [Paenibacillus sp. yr247]SDO86748.1 Ca-activated chloride channel family protein [Paenibacillus sp. yr247]